MRKPNLHGKVARAAISAALTGVMTVSGVVAPMATAFAQTITLESKQSTQDMTQYYAFKVFDAGDVDKDTYVVTDAVWTSNTAIRAAVLKYINSQGFATWLSDKGLTGADATTSAANALNFISEKIAEDEANGASYNYSNSGALDIANRDAHITAADSFATGLAKAIAETAFVVSNKANNATDTMTKITATDEEKGITVNASYYTPSDSGKITIDPKEADGFYVLVPELYYTRTDAGAVTTSFENQAPIWVPYTGADLQIAVKDYIGTIAKVVKDDATGAVWGSVADAAKGQYVDFQITATLPKAASGLSALYIDDTLPDGMTLNEDSVKVSANGGDAKAIETATSGSVKTWNILNSASGLAEGDSVVITYQAALNEVASTGLSSYNTNEAILRYTETGGSTEQKTVVSTTNMTAYQLALNLVDSASLEAIRGTNATFTIQDENNQYVTADGQLTGVRTVLDMASATSLTIPYIDEGVFTVTQVTAPDGYELTSSNVVKVTVTADKEQGKVIKLAATSEGGNAEVVSVVDGSGLITVRIPNIAKDTIVLPITGMTPSQLGTLAGALFLVAAVALYLVRRRGTENA